MSAEQAWEGSKWAIVLAAGEGSRLSELTTRGGRHTPKQYCSLRGGRSLLADAIERAARLVSRKRIMVVVAEQHRDFWSSELAQLPPENTIVQPRNRGTAAGVLLPLLTVLERDPRARVAILPSDHALEDEGVLSQSMRIGFDSLLDLGEGVTLFGMSPETPEPGLGWIVPARSERLIRPVQRFVEKPDPRLAAELFAHGGLWNSFLMIGASLSLVRLFERRLPRLLDRLLAAFAARDRSRAARLEQAYAELETQDLSRDLLQDSAEQLRVLIVPPCGWTDLGTPSRVMACLSSTAPRTAAGSSSARATSLDLSWAVESLRARSAPAASVV